MKSPPSFVNRGMIQVAAATSIFGLWHSFLCSQRVKKATEKQLGFRVGRGGYRLFFIFQSLITTTALVAFVLSRPHRTVYEAKGAARRALQGGQLGWLIFMAWSAHNASWKQFLGWEDALAGWQSEPIAGAETQGPNRDQHGVPRPTGPFRWLRHPMDVAPLGLLWMSPVGKTNWLAFNLVATLYTLATIGHEEARAQAKNPDAWAAYQAKTPTLCPFARPHDS